MHSQRSHKPIPQSNISRRIRKALAICDETLRLFETAYRKPGEKGIRLGRQAQLQARPDFEAIDPSIRPIIPPGVKPATIVQFPSSATGQKRDAEDESVAGFWAY